ncbi:MAG: hypothetical protein U9Q82_01005 [Chloroflexota bacterium]|nr:hypothetical protein [Chloroflexota bacterium]
MNALKNKRPLIIFVSIMFAIVLTQCSPAYPRSTKPSSDWSRGLRVAADAIGTPSIIAADKGELIDIVWPLYATETQQTLHYMQLDETATPVSEHNLSFSFSQVRIPHILPASDGKIHTFWESRTVSGGKWTLWYGLLDPTGKLLSTPEAISAPDIDMKSYHLAGDADGGVLVVWETNHGIFGTHLDSMGKMLSEPIQITTAGKNPFISAENNNIFMAWWAESGIRFQRFDTQFETSEGILISKPRLSGADELHGPVLETTDEWVYAAWSIRRQTGLEAGSAYTQFAAFPLGEPTLVEPNTIQILPTILETYAAYDGAYTLTQLVPPVSTPYSSEFVYNPVPALNSRGEFALAITAKQEYHNQMVPQVVLTLFRDGQHIGYSQAVKTQLFSSSPALASDNAGNLHLAWREGYSGSEIYYATTAAIARKNLDKLQIADFAQAILAGLIEGLASLVLAPLIGIMWMLPGFLILVIYKLVRDLESLDSWLSWGFLIATLILYQLLKWISFTPLITYTPFSAWIDIPAAWSMPLRVGGPALIFACTILVAEWRRRSRSLSTVVYYLIVTIIDIALTMLIYGVSFLGLS